MNVVTIPGLRLRPFAGAPDYDAIAGILKAANRADGVEWIPDAAALRVEFENMAEFDPSIDVVVAELDGRVVGYGQAGRDVRDGIPVYSTGGAVHPEFRHRGIGRSILRHNEARLRQVAGAHPDETTRMFGAWVADREGGARELLTSEGYGPVRFGFAMRRPTLEDLPAVSLPEGIEIRPVAEEHLRPIHDADNEAFRDHWGHRESTEEDFRWLVNAPDRDTSLWRVAWDGTDVAGSVITFVFKSENEVLGVRRGWLERISVRRPWRRRGLATALIASALEGLRDAGMDDAMLGVDAENPTGALQLYEALGFVVHDRSTTYRKAW